MVNYYNTVKILCRVMLTLFWNITVKDSGKFPQKGGQIIVANHESLLDGFILGVVLPRQGTFLSAKYLFSYPVVGWFLRKIGALPVEIGKSNISSTKLILKNLKKGGMIILFPEGGIKKNNSLHKGAAFFSLKTGVPIIPVAIKKEKGFSLFDLLSPKGRVKVSISSPIFPSSKDDVIKLNKKILASFYNMGVMISEKK